MCTKRNFVLQLICLLSIHTHAQGTRLNKNELHPAPVPYFFITGLCYGDTTRFINQSDVGTIQWSVTNDKGDTLFRTTGNHASYYFKKRGAYNVCLTADNGHQTTKIRTVLVDTITKADFTFRYCQQVFDNLSACSDQYIWVLPDGSTSTDTFPSFRFKAPGTYPLKLIAIKGNRRDTLTTSMTLKGDQLGPPSAVFTFRKISEPSTFEFKALDSTENHYTWYFGDQTFSDTSGYKVIHTIDKEKYQQSVSLWVSNACGFSNFDLDPFATTGINNEVSEYTVLIFPNPASGEVTISASGIRALNPVTAKLMDVNGRIMETGDLTIANGFEVKWNTSHLAKGIYLIQIIGGEQVLSRKMAVQ